VWSALITHNLLAMGCFITLWLWVSQAGDLGTLSLGEGAKGRLGGGVDVPLLPLREKVSAKLTDEGLKGLSG